MLSRWSRRAALRSAAAGLTLPLAAGLVSGGGAVEAKSFEPLGYVSIDAAFEAVVGADGETVYVAADDGFVIVDVSDPTAPRVLSETRDLMGESEPSLTDIRDVQVDGDRLAVPGPATPGTTDQFHGFRLYDVSDPTDPVPVTEPYETGYHIHNCYLDGETLFVVANDMDRNPLVLFDVGDDDVIEIGQWSLLDVRPEWEPVHGRLRYLHDVFVHNDVAYLPHWNAGTYLVDVADPTDPTSVGHVIDPDVDLDEQRAYSDDEVSDAQFALPGNDHYATVDDSGSLLVINRESWALEPGTESGAGPVELYDASDPTAIEFLARIDPPATTDASYEGGHWTTSHNFELRDGRLYTSWYQGGVKVHDVSDPSTPVELAHWRDDEVAAFWTARVASPGETFVASSTAMVPNASTESGLYTFPIPTDSSVERSGTEPPRDGGMGGEDDAGGRDADPILGPGPKAAIGAVSLVTGGLLGVEYVRRKADEEL